MHSMKFYSWVGYSPPAARGEVRICLEIEDVSPSAMTRLRNLGFRSGTKTRLNPDICAVFARSSNELRNHVKRSKQKERGHPLSFYIGRRGISSFWVRTRIKSRGGKALSFVCLGAVPSASAVGALFAPLMNVSEISIDYSDLKIVAGGRIGRLQSMTFDECNNLAASKATAMWISPAAPEVDSDVPKFETAIGNLGASLSEYADIKVALNPRLKFTERLIVGSFSEAAR